MSITNYSPQRYTVLESVSAADNYGSVVLAGDFKTRMVELIAGTGLDGELVIYESNQNDAPDVSAPVSASNSYYPVGYLAVSDQSFYDTDNPFVPSSAGDYAFNVESTGSVWIIACVLNRTAGTVTKLSVTLFDNQ